MKTLLYFITYPFRFVGTALCFGLFGLGGLLFRFPIAPILNLDADTDRRHRRARLLVQRWFAVFVGIMRGLRLIRIEVIHPERLNRPGLLVTANHPSLIDVVCLMSLIPYGTTVVKDALTRNPFTAAPIRASGYTSNAAGIEALEKVSGDLELGASMVIFPEGTRTPVDLPEGEYPRMHRGVAALAFETNRPLTPVRITASPRWLTKDRGWWHLPPRAMTLTFEILEDIPVEPLADLYNHRPAIACRKLTAALQKVLFH